MRNVPSLRDLALGPEFEGVDGGLDDIAALLLDHDVRATVLVLGGDELVRVDGVRTLDRNEIGGAPSGSRMDREVERAVYDRRVGRRDVTGSVRCHGVIGMRV